MIDYVTITYSFNEQLTDKATLSVYCDIVEYLDGSPPDVVLTDVFINNVSINDDALYWFNIDRMKDACYQKWLNREAPE